MHYINSGDNIRQMLIRFLMYLILGLITIGLTVISVFAVQGYDLDRSSGQLIQNGLMLVDSVPKGARVYLNGQPEDDITPSRFALPAGTYDVKIELEGHRDWSRTVDVLGSQVTWLYYPALVPDVISTSLVRDVQGLRIFEQSRDNRQILINTAQQSKQLQVIRTASEESNEVVFDLSDDLLINPNNSARLELLDWHNQGRYLLLRVTQGNRSQVIWVDAADRSESHVVSGSRSNDFKSVRFTPDPKRILVLNEGGTLFEMDLEESLTERTLISENIIEFTKDFGSLNYAVRQNGDIYELMSIDESQGEVLLGSQRRISRPRAAVYEGDTFVSVVRGTTLSIFRNPEANEASVAEKVIELENIDNVTFSTHGRFILVTSPENSVVYDFERTRSHNLDGFGSDHNLAWLDSPRLSAVRDGQLILLDFDGSNQYEIVDAVSGQKVFIDEESRFMYSVARSSVSDRLTLQRSDLLLAE